MAQDEVSKHRKIHILLIVILIVGVINLVVLLTIETGGTNSAESARISAQNAEAASDDVQQNAAQTQPAAQASDSACSGGANYDATIGKFKLTLSNPNVILRILDDTYEGGPITSLSIGQCVGGEKNVVDIHPDSEVSIIAHPTATSAELRASYEAEVGISFGREPDTTVDGVTAEVYTYSTLTSVKVLYFDNNGIGYEIEIPDDNPTTNSILNDIRSDWAFY